MPSPFTIPFNTARPEQRTCAVMQFPGRWGVTATRALAKGSIVERSLVRCIDDQYWFLWQDGHFVFGSGLSQLYNHSAVPNVEVVRDYANMRMYFFAIKDIRQDEELCHCYPDWRRYAIGSEAGTDAAALRPPAMSASPRKLPGGMPVVSDSVEVRPSNIDRMGVFARRAIAAGELIELALVLPVAEAPWFNWGRTDRVFCSGIPHFFAVSSQEANVDAVEVRPHGLMDFVVTRDVAAGEELVIRNQVREPRCATPPAQVAQA
jgi:hypothetical protein